MTDQELKKLRRSDLLELLIAQGKENEQLRARLAQAEAQLAERKVLLTKAGSIAEASLQLNGVFEAAQAAAEQYMENVRRLSGQQEQICARLESESRQTAERRSQVGSGDRSQRIRTYNYPQGRVTDHRIGLTLHQLPAVLDGGLDPIIDALAAADTAARLEAQGND